MNYELCIHNLSTSKISFVNNNSLFNFQIFQFSNSKSSPAQTRTGDPYIISVVL